LGLLQNISVLSAEPIRNTGGAAIQCVNRSSYNRNEQQINKYVGFAGIDKKSGVPDGYRHPYAWNLPLNSGGIAARNSIFGEGTFDNSIIAGGKNVSIALAGIGAIYSAAANLVIYGAASLLGSGDINADIMGKFELIAELLGSGDLISSLNAAVSLLAELTASGNLTADIIAQGNMSSTVLGEGNITYAVLNSVISAVSLLSGNGTLTTDIEGIFSMSADLSASGNIISALRALGNIVAEITSAGSIDAGMRADAYMTASITPFTELSPENLAIKVWDSIATEFNRPGTMGEKLNSAGGGSSPTDIADAVWNELKTDHDISDSFGELTQKTEKKVDDNQALIISK